MEQGGEGAGERAVPDGAGMVGSRVLPGFTIGLGEIFAGVEGGHG